MKRLFIIGFKAVSQENQVVSEKYLKSLRISESGIRVEFTTDVADAKLYRSDKIADSDLKEVAYLSRDKRWGKHDLIALFEDE